MSEDQDKQLEEQVAEVMRDYGYTHPFPTEPYILCKRWLEGGSDATVNYQAFKRIAKTNKLRAENRKYNEMQERREGGAIDTYTDI